MKQKFVIFILALTVTGYAQKKSIDLSLSAGISSPSTAFSDKSYASNGNFFDFSAAYYFSKIGAGISVGSFSNPTDENFTKSTNLLAFPTINSTEDWKTTYYGVGPEFKTSFSKLEASFITRIGMMTVKPIRLSGGYAIDNADFSSNVIDFGSLETSNLSYYSAGIKLGYEIIPNLSLFVKADYLSSLSKEITISERVKRIRDINKNGVIDQEDFFDAAGQLIDFETTLKNIKPQTTNFGIGLSYSFGKTTKKIGKTEKSSAGGHQNPYFQEKEFNGEMMIHMKPPTNSGSVVFTNPAKEKADKKNKQQKIIGVLPTNNSQFKNQTEIKNFTWKVIGTKIANPQFILEVTKIGNNQQSQRVFIEKTSKTSLAATNIFKENKLSDGQYRWKVTETTSGNSSDIMFFSFSNCEIDFAISNEEIECLGYEGENRKFKICFDSTYSSSSGDLTFANPGTGLTVFDQSYAPLSYTLVSPNPTLVTQIGTSTTTVSYCFEVTVPTSVTAIGFGLQGDDLDPSPVLCQPGVSANFDELPECICDECEEIELSFDNCNISLNGTSGNQFNFNGNINVNVPIYGIEFQIQSYSYNANPSACTTGISSVEESGMILMPETTINGSTSLQLVNETASGSPSSNNNATKNIKYTSTSPLTGAIPVNLTIGLPGPISGLDPSCCVIDYTVCIKVKVFYEESNCKSCVFTHCFTFNNQ